MIYPQKSEMVTYLQLMGMYLQTVHFRETIRPQSLRRMGSGGLGESCHIRDWRKQNLDFVKNVSKQCAKAHVWILSTYIPVPNHFKSQICTEWWGLPMNQGGCYFLLSCFGLACQFREPMI